MNFTKAIECLNDGARIGRQSWTGNMFLQKKDDKIRSFMTATSNYNWSTEMFLSSDWMKVGDDTITLPFTEAVEELKKGSKIKLPEWEDMYLVLDNNMRTVVLKHLVFHEWQPVFNDLCAEDWEEI